jgi:hypothetical protein
MAAPTSLKVPRNLVHHHDEAHGLHIYVWADEYDSTRQADTGKGIAAGTPADQYRLVYQVVGFAEQFNPLVFKKVQALPPGDNPTAVDVYGLPITISMKGHKIVVRITNLASAQSDETQRYPGEWVVGRLKDDITINPGTDTDPRAIDWIVWEQVSASIGVHRVVPPVLELCESASVNPTWPAGAVGIEYERNADGTVKTDANGNPKVALVDGGTNTPADLKVGALVMSFQKDFFGTGKHAWIGSGASTIKPFTIKITTDADPENPSFFINVIPGVVNGVLPSWIPGYFGGDPKGWDMGTMYVYLNMTSAVNNITAAIVCVESSPPPPIVAVKGGLPTDCNMMIGVVYPQTPYLPLVAQMWPGGNVRAVAGLNLVTDKSAAAVGSSVLDRWWHWRFAVGS